MNRTFRLCDMRGNSPALGAVPVATREQLLDVGSRMKERCLCRSFWSSVFCRAVRVTPGGPGRSLSPTPHGLDYLVEGLEELRAVSLLKGRRPASHFTHLP